MKLYILTFLFLVIGTISSCIFSHDKNDNEDSYVIETVETPEGLTVETGGLDFLPNGKLIACFLRGDVMIYDPKTKEWRLFAQGLHEPLGIMAVSNSEVLVMQRPELTRLKDIDGDGEADVYETVTDDFGQSGNYHEFNYGPVKDKDGNLFFALNSASAGGGVRSEVRGKLDTLGRSHDKSMFSVVPYRGWIMKLNPDGKLQPYAMGFRSPNGLGFDAEGNLFATDNQGDWVGTSKLYHIQEGNFYGHPGSLIWKKGWGKGNPFDLPLNELDRMRTKAAVLFPQDIMANSPTQPLCDITEGRFGPFAGQLFVGEMNSPRIVRVMLEKVAGKLQGACTPFIDSMGLQKGNNRLAFAPDGSLWVGQAAFGWGGDRGIQRINYTGKTPVDIYSMNLTSDGFELTFTQPVDRSSALDLNNYRFRRYYYEYHSKYGSDRMDEKSISISNIMLSPDGKVVSLALDNMRSGYVYQLNLDNIKAKSGDSLTNKVICYTVNNLKPSP